MWRKVFFIIAFFFVFTQFAFSSAEIGTIDAIDKHARGLQTGVGLINFGATNGNVTVTDNAITGHAWSETHGWINLAPAQGGVTNDEEGNLAGYAWGENTGWINFAPANGGVTINNNGYFFGHAWSENIGWISFNCANESYCGTLDHKVRTDWRPKSVRDGDPPGGPNDSGETRLYSYLCPSGTSVSRAVNGPANNGTHTVPANCESPSGITFGYTNQPDKNDFSPPFLGLSDNAPFSIAGITNVLGTVLANITVPSGRYNFAEVYGQNNTRIPDSKYFGFFCTDDPNNGADNYDSAIPTSSGDRYCVAYRTLDLCPNLTGIQRTVPYGWSINSSGSCVQDSLPDVCPNIEGTQTTIPEGMVINEAGSCVLPQPCQFLPGELKQDIDVVLAIDTSGSMSGQKMTNAKSAGIFFVDSLVAGSDRVGLVSYSSSAILRNGLTTNFTSVKNNISGLNAGGTTAIGSAIQVAKDELLNNGRPHAKKVLIVLSDGYAVPRSQVTIAVDQANELKQAGITLYSIGLGSSVDAALLGEIATSLSHYYYAPSGSDLQDIYAQISAIECTARPTSVSGVLFNDVNENGIRELSEVGIGGMTISLTSVDGSIPTRTLSTLSDGTFSFPSVADGAYMLCQAPTSGWRATLPAASPSCYLLAVIQGINISDILFGAVADPDVDIGPPPTITLLGDNPLFLDIGDTFIDPGATAFDVREGDITSRITVTGSVNTSVIGTYFLTYSVMNIQGVSATPVVRVVQVGDIPGDENQRPVITLLGDNPLFLNIGDIFIDPGATAFDPEDGDITDLIIVSGTVNTSIPGSYILTYTVADSQGLQAIPVVRIVDVTSPDMPIDGRPVITLLGDNPLLLEVGDIFIDPGATAFDPEDGDITDLIIVSGTVDTSTVGSYQLVYRVTDSDGNEAIPAVRIVDVRLPGTDYPGPRDDDSRPDDDKPGPRFDIEVLFPRIGDGINRLIDFLRSPGGIAASLGGLGAGLLSLVPSLLSSAFSISDMFLSLIRLWHSLLAFFGFRRRERPWGTVYDSVTKQPLDPAYVVLNDLSEKEKASAITDLDGRYGFLVEPGSYRMIANKTNYVFPSERLFGKIDDGMYKNLYFGGEINIDERDAVIIKNIPMDPIGFDWNEFAKRSKRLMRFYSRTDKSVSLFFRVLFMAGAVFSIFIFTLSPSLINAGILALYALVILIRLFIAPPRSYGSVIDESGNPLSFAVIKVFFANSETQVARAVADRFGRYFILVAPGDYYVRIDKKNEDETYTAVYASAPFHAKKGVINSDIQVEQVYSHYSTTDKA